MAFDIDALVSEVTSGQDTTTTTVTVASGSVSEAKAKSGASGKVTEIK